MVDVPTIGLFLLSILVAYVCGYGVVTLLLPDDYEEYRFVIMPPVGYTVFVWAAYTFSGTLQVATAKSCLIVFWVLALLSLAVAIRWRPALEGQNVLRGLKKSSLLMAPILVVVLWPLFHVGAETFLGAVNPDYYASLIDNNFLRDNPITARSSVYDSYYPVKSLEGRLPISARFGSTVYPILLEALFGIDPRTAMTISIAMFLSCLPLSVFFMSRVVTNFTERAAWFAAILASISGCIAMSYVYYYVGQNSGIGCLPVVIGALYLLVIRPSFRLTVLAALLVSSFFTMYMGMLAYALAPIGVLGLYMLIWREMSLKRGAALVFGFIAALVVVNLGMLTHVARGFAGWRDLVGLSLQGQFFLDFLTEQYVPIFIGLANYPLPTSYLSQWLGLTMVPILTGLSIGLFGVMIYFTSRWAQELDDRKTVVMMVGGVFIYGVVWFIYTYFRQYGYAVFKMSSWMQFVQVLPWAYGLDWLLRRQSTQSGRSRIATRSILGVLTIVIVGGNLLASHRLTSFSLGRTTEIGYIVNHYEVSGNRDYFDLAEAMEGIVKDDESIGLGFTDVIQNSWVYYYLRDFRVSVLAHYVFPSDDENLPDIKTRLVTDYYGNVGPDYNQFFHGATDDYFLTQTADNLNTEIVDQELPAPIWRNQTFQLLRTDEASAFAMTGRGWYRIEYRGAARSGVVRDYWWPKSYRWTGEGGELYMFGADPSVARRLAFTGIVGFGLDSSSRTVQLWLNGEVFDEVTIDEAARVVSKPFYPTGDADRIVIKVIETVQPPPRQFRLWNRDIPGDYRRLNMAVSNVTVMEAGREQKRPMEVYDGHSLFSHAHSFNGLKLNQWVGKGVSLTLPIAADPSSVDLLLFVPGHPALKFPYKLKISLNGIEHEAVAEFPGDLALSIPVTKRSGSNTLDLAITPEQTFVPDDVDHDYRPTVQSFRLMRVALKSGAGA